jgi:transposase-like protein
MRVSTLLINAEIARIYSVSEPTVSKWVKSAEEGKNTLEITKNGSRFYVLDTPHNRTELRRLAQKGIKYKNKLKQASLISNKQLYEVFEPNHLVDLVTALESSSPSIPLKFSYFGQELKIWNHHSHTIEGLLSELKTSNMKLKYISTYPDQTHTLAVCSSGKN